MVAIFTGAGAGFTRGSANLLGGAGQLGSGLLGRGGDNVAVNAATGNLLVSRQDEYLVGRGPDIGISRSYNSLQDVVDGDNGDNWQQSTSRRVFGLTGALGAVGSTIKRLGEDGAAVTYTWNAAASAYVTTDGAGAHDRLTHAGGVWTWTDGDTQGKETYTAYGADNWRIATAADTDGNTLTFTYSGAQLYRVTTADGAWTQYVWSGNNITQIVTGYTDLATSTAKTLTRTRYAYDASNRLITVTTDLSPGDNSVADGQIYTTSYTYDGASNRIASITQSDGSLLTIAYDGSGRVTTLTQTAATGVTRITTLTYAAGYTQVTMPDGQVARLDYDASARLTKITAPPATTGGTAQETSFTYDAAGNVTSVTDPRGKVTAYLHDANGNVTRITDANGNVVERTYDARNLLITELAYGADQSGASVAHYTQYAYDSKGHLRYAVNAAGQVTKFEYTAAGELARRIEYPKHAYAVGPAAITEAGMDSWVAGRGDLSSAKITAYTYDLRGNQTGVTTYGAANAAGAGLTTEGVSSTTYTYDQSGRLLVRTRSGQQAESFVYDGMGRLVGSTDVHGGTTTIVFNDAALTTTITSATGYVSISTFNKAGELISRADSGTYTVGGTTTYQYDKNGRARIVTDPTGRTSYVVYDKAGRLVADVNHLGEMVEYRYDAANRLVATVRHANLLSAAQLTTLANPDHTAELSALLPASSTSDIWNWTIYDDGGRVAQTIAGDGSVASFAYDQSDRLVRTTAYYNKLSAAQLTALKATLPAVAQAPTAHARDAVSRSFYNEAGQLIGTLDGEGYLTRVIYDAAGQKIREVAYATATMVASRASGTFATLLAQVENASTVDRTMRFVYDGQGLLRYTVDARGGVVFYRYDAAGQVTSVTAYATPIAISDFSYTAVKAAVVTSAFDRTNWSVHDMSGRLAYALDARGGVTAYRYDNAGRVVKVIQFGDLYGAVASLPTKATMDSWAATNRPTNRITRNWYSERGELLFTVDPEGYVSSVTYDAQGRKLSETARPNRVVASDTTTLAQITTLAAGAGTGISQSYSYDQAGRLLTSTDGEGFVTRNIYNALGQLVDVYAADNVAADKTRTHFDYDGAGRLVAEYRAYGATEQAGSFYAYDGLGNRVSTTDANGNTTTFTHDRAGRILTATNALGGVVSYEYDAFGNVVKATDAKGNKSYSYYDNLDRVISSVDAFRIVTEITYNAFGEAISTTLYSRALSAEPVVGTVPVVFTGTPPEVTAAYATAADKQAIADAKAAQLATARAGYNAAIANRLAFYRMYVAQLDAQVAAKEAELAQAEANGDPAANAINLELVALRLKKVDAELALVMSQVGLGLLYDYTIIQPYFRIGEFQQQWNVADAEARQALREAQRLDAEMKLIKVITQFGYDRRGQLSWKIDAENYFERYTYNAFGEQVSITRYSQKRAENAPLPPEADSTPSEVAAAYANAAALQAQADTAQAAVAAEQAALAAALLAPLPHLQARLTQLNTELAALQTQYNNANFFDKFLIWLPQIQQKQSEITLVETEVRNFQTFGFLSFSGREMVEANFNVAGLQAQATNAQNAANTALAAAQALDAQYGGVVGARAYTEFTYDNRGQLTKATDARGFYESYAYDAYGRRISQTAKSATGTISAGGVTTYTYDKRGLLLSETLPIASYTSSGAVQAATVTNRFTYDARGNMLTRIEAQGLTEQRTTTYTYDKQNRLTETKGDTVGGLTINGSQVVSTVSGRPTETITYDARGNVIRTVDAAGAKTVFFYDALNRKVVEVDALGKQTRYSYDANGNVTEIRVYDAASPTNPANGGTAAQAPAAPGGTYRITQFTYDARDRLLTSSVLGVVTGTVPNGTWNTSSAAITTTYTYNFLGQLATLTEPEGGTNWSYYDRLGRKTAQLESGALTTWTLDAEGNVLEERRYASGANGPFNITSAPTAATHATDRVTQYTYDANGNRLSETRLAVETYDGTYNATISYLYNGLGQVIRKTEATGDQTNYTYDAGGRLLREAKPLSAIDYRYSGVGNLTRTVQAAANGSDARVTTYAYGAGGRLSSMTDAASYVHSYYYDVAGRMVLESYVRTKSDNSSVTEAVGHRFDVLGRNIGQAYFTLSGSTWVVAPGIDNSTLGYNLHGDLITIGINGLTQQQNRYDAAGRMFATNSGDGVWKYFGYDRNGNQTLVVTSAGYNLGGNLSITDAYALAARADVNATLTTYNVRNLAVQTIEEGRELGGSTEQLVTTRSYNAFGEVASETDANGGYYSYDYNTLGRLRYVQSPSVQITTETGATQSVAPTERRYYDLSGRLTARSDANNNLTRYTLLAGSGYGGTQALVTQELHADGGTVNTSYNAHGDALSVTDEVGIRTVMVYDNLGRLTRSQQNVSGALIDNYVYDVLGQRIKHTNDYFADAETTDYDIQGRIISQRAFGGDKTQMTYGWQSTIATGGVGTFGGWIETTTYENGKTLVEKKDLFDRIVERNDLGNKITAFTYDAAGRLLEANSGNAKTTYIYFNTGRISRALTATFYEELVSYTIPGGIISFPTQVPMQTWADYTYDKLGNRKTEKGYELKDSTTTQWKNQEATYDALGRMLTWKEFGTAGYPTADIAYSYDAVGNVRRSIANYRVIDPTGAASSAVSTQDFYFRYDSMNRLVIDRGILSGGTIVRNLLSQDSKEIQYDAAGRRVAVLTYKHTGAIGMNAPRTQEQREMYLYDAFGRLKQVDITLGAQAVWTGTSPNWVAPTVPAASATTTSTTDRAVFTYDKMGRLLTQQDLQADGVTSAYSRTLTYNTKGQILTEATSTRRGSDIFTSTSNYFYTDANGYALGSVTLINTSNRKNSGTIDLGSFAYTYDWREGAVQTKIVNKPNASTTWTTNLKYDDAGRLTSANIQDGKTRSVTYRIDENGQVIRRDESRPSNAPSGQTGSPHEVWYRFAGREMGYVGNNKTADMSYSDSIAERQAPQLSNPGTFRNQQTAGGSYADFAQSYDPINSYSQGASGGSYTARTGDTLQSIAQAVWGDASLWYKLAEANGLSGNAGLIEGQVLTLPAGVLKNAHNAGTVQPYDPAEAVGDLNPTTPKPKKKNKCGGFGMILIAVVAIAVTTIVTAGAAAALSGASFSSSLTATLGGSLAGLTSAAAGATALGTAGAIAAGVAGAAVGSIVSQGFGVATGLQDKFSWKGVAMSALSGGVGAGLGTSFGSGWAAAGARGALSSAITQGVGVATGLQSKFDFAGVAAAGAGAAAGSFVGGKTQLFGKFGSGLAGNTAGGIANAAARSAINGESFGDNLRRAMPDVIGNTIGNLVADGIAGGGRPSDKLLDQLGVSRGSLSAGDRAALKAYDREVKLADREAEGRVELGEVSLTAETSRRLDQSYRAALEASAKTPAARAMVDDYYALVDEQFSSPQLTVGGAVTGDGPVIEVVANPNQKVFVTSKLIDGGGIALGSTARRFGRALADEIVKRPGLGLAIQAADTALKIWGGPLRYAGGAAYESLKGGIQSRLEGAFAGLDYTAVQSSDGSSGITLAGSILLSGLGSIKAMGGPAPRIQSLLSRYPEVIDLRTGRAINLPSDIGGKVPRADRVPWGAKERGGFIKEWYGRGYETPRGGWSEYDIHHIKPREYGGSNDFWNLTPVPRQSHQQLNAFWRGFRGL